MSAEAATNLDPSTPWPSPFLDKASHLNSCIYVAEAA
jgi:hypothetical protein